MLPWVNAQHARRLMGCMTLSVSQLNRLFSSGVINTDHLVLQQLEKNPKIDISGIQPALGSTMIYSAAGSDNKAMVGYLLRFDNIDVNLGDNELTPLYTAACEGYKEIVKLLLEHPNIDTSKQCNGLTAMDIAKQKGHHDIANLIRRHDQKIQDTGNEHAENRRNKKQKM